MTPWIALPLAVLVSVPVHFAVRRALHRPSPEAASGPVPAERGEDLAAAVEALSAELARLREARDTLAARLLAGARGPAAVAATVGDDEIRAAVERWHAAAPARGAAEAGGAGRQVTVTPGAAGVETMDVNDILAIFADASWEDAEGLWQAIRDAGRMDEVVAAFEAMADAEPEDSGLRVAVGVAYLQKIFELGATPEAGLWAGRADQAFNQALELDPNNWDARFIKAVALSNWPTFLGRTSEAIEHFQILIQQQEQRPVSPQHAMTFLYLGNMHLQTGDVENALDVWRRGAARFPDHEELRRQIELNTP